MQQFFINERCVRSKTLTSALEAAYRSYIPGGKFPSCVLHVTIPASLVDVNIHPAKLEVKFSDEKTVFDAVFASIRRALSVGISRPEMNLSDLSEKTHEKEKLQDLFREAEEKGEKSEKQEVYEEPPKPSAEEPRQAPFVFEARTLSEPSSPVQKPIEKPLARFSFDDDLPVDIPVVSRKEEAPVRRVNAFGTVSDFDYLKTLYASAIRKAEEPKIEPAPIAPIPEKTDANIAEAPTKPIPEYRIVGEIFASYIIVETEDKILMVDKHAAHERINFERLRANMDMDTPDVQMILTPEKIAVSTEEAAFCEEYRKDLEACGFEFSVAPKEIAVRGIPFGFEKSEARSLFLAIVGEGVNSSVPPESTKRAIFERALYQSSCKASVKAGRIYDGAHLRWICDNLFRYDCVKYCPHGRPVAFEISKKEIDARFGRV
jgi:DNA mismatch repair protein MutL